MAVMHDQSLPLSRKPASVKKRKHESTTEEIEIDLNAPEPPSKKDQRKAKRIKSDTRDSQSSTNTKGALKNGSEDDPKPNRGARSQHGIWIGNLSFSTTKSDLMGFMTSDPTFPIEEDQITRINMPLGNSRNGKTQNKGFAYIDLADEATFRHALELSEKLLVGRRVLIKDARSFEGRPEKSKTSAETNTKAPSKRIFIGNLNFDSNAESVEKHFGVCGRIKSTHVATFEDSGKCKGYAWVEFEDLSSAESAMRGWVEEGQLKSSGTIKRSGRRIWLHNIDGRKLRLEYAEDATTRYNKRFGKNAPEKGQDRNEKQQDNYKNKELTEENLVDDHDKNTTSRQRPHSKARKGYEGQAVQRLTGAIVESKGQKTVFD